MDISRISRLIYALGDTQAAAPRSISAEQKGNQQPALNQTSAPKSTEAVQLSPEFGRASAAFRADAEPAPQISSADKVRALKEQVQRGSYRPGSREIAESVARELLN